MSLSAVVYCDCVEKGRLAIPHPRPDLLFIDERGTPDIASSDPGDIEAHDRWESLQPCQHEHFWLVERWLGNISTIGAIRSLMTQCSANPALEYTVLWSKVVYDGSHSGDFLTGDDVIRLNDEADRFMKKVPVRTTDTIPVMEFFRKLQDLVRASLVVNKPISF